LTFDLATQYLLRTCHFKMLNFFPKLFEIPPASGRVMVRTCCLKLFNFFWQLTIKYDLDLYSKPSHTILACNSLPGVQISSLNFLFNIYSLENTHTSRCKTAWAYLSILRAKTALCNVKAMTGTSPKKKETTLHSLDSLSKISCFPNFNVYLSRIIYCL
jgi:hypothetical protein